MGKVVFSKPLARQWDIYNKIHKSNENVEQFVKRMLAYIASKPDSWHKQQSNIFSLCLWHSDAAKEMLHLYFMDASLKGFLEDLKLADIDGIIKYIDENGFLSQQGFLQVKYFSFGIHIPNEERNKAFAFGLMNNQFDQVVLTWSTGSENGWCSIKNYRELLNVDTKEAKEITKIFRFAFNTIAYMEAFPECIQEGVPKFVNVSRKAKNFIVSISDKVLESRDETGRMTRPHFRKGYYKRLSSDFYKNKKGQIIFVSETMVNGKAKTVYPKEGLDDIDSLT